jgi:hypothetical protein
MNQAAQTLAAGIEAAPAPEWVEVLRLAVAGNRGPEPHASDTQCTLKAWARRHGHDAGPTVEEAAQWIDGLAWDEWVRKVLPSRTLLISRGKEYEARGLRFTPDAVVLEDGRLVAIEFKHTRYSVDKPVRDMGSFIWQLAIYTALLPEATGLPTADYGYLLLLHSLGRNKKDYSENRPTLAAWRVRFAPSALAAVAREAEERARRVTGARRPAPDALWPWLCERCTVRQAIGCPGVKAAAAPARGWKRRTTILRAEVL